MVLGWSLVNVSGVRFVGSVVQGSVSCLVNHQESRVEISNCKWTFISFPFSVFTSSVPDSSVRCIHSYQFYVWLMNYPLYPCEVTFFSFSDTPCFEITCLI